MQVNGRNYHTIWVHPDNKQIIQVIDQRKLPFDFQIIDLKTAKDTFECISNMTVRGAPLIGVTGAFGIYLTLTAASEENWKNKLLEAAVYLKSSRPTAVNLALLIDEIIEKISMCDSKNIACSNALSIANKMASREIEWSEAIGEYGCDLIESVSKQKNGQPVNILTHCNAGWLACIDWGTATAPIYKAVHKGIAVHIWVDETRPRNQGARLTSWELEQEGVPHTVIPDNTGGHLMQHGHVDLCIVGSDRTTVTGDVANKIGTYLKALAAYDNNIPFYVALPSSSIDFEMKDGISEIPIEQRDGDEVRWMEGMNGNGEITKIRITGEHTAVANYGFDVTPAKYITALITERGICSANEKEILKLFPQKDRKIVSPKEGTIKFDCQLTVEKLIIPSELFIPLNFWRNELWDKCLIGAYPDGIGYGNISVRVPQTNHFYISGTTTGGIPELDQIHYPLVEFCDPDKNQIRCRGQIKASAESMSHSAIYAADPEIGAVVHIHNLELWEKYVDVLPSTSRLVEYGTPEMAHEISKIMKLPETLSKKVFVMGGHKEGIIGFGRTVEEATLVLLALRMGDPE